MFKEFKKIITCTDMSSLTKRECRLYGIFFICSCNIVTLLMFILIYLGNPSLNEYLICVSIFLLISCPFLVSTFYPELNEKYDLKSMISLMDRCNYQCQVLYCLSLLPGGSIFAFELGYILYNLWVGIGFALALVVPVIMVFVKINVFNDQSLLINGKITESSMGYNTYFYVLFALIIGLFGYYYGFTSLSLSVFKESFVPILFSVLWILLVFIFQLILLSPDKLNKVLSFEVKTKRGMLFYVFTVCIIFVIFVIFTKSLVLISA